MPIFWRTGRSLDSESVVISDPSTRTVPEVARSSPLIMRTRVDFPAPEYPIMPKISPRLIRRLTSSTARTAEPLPLRNSLTTWSSSIIASPSADPLMTFPFRALYWMLCHASLQSADMRRSLLCQAPRPACSCRNDCTLGCRSETPDNQLIAVWGVALAYGEDNTPFVPIDLPCACCNRPCSQCRQGHDHDALRASCSISARNP